MLAVSESPLELQQLEQAIPNVFHELRVRNWGVRKNLLVETSRQGFLIERFDYWYRGVTEDKGSIISHESE